MSAAWPRVALTLGGVLCLAGRAVAAPAAGDAPRGVRYEKAIEVPARGAEELSVVNRLGSVRVVGWDQLAVRVRAFKRAPSALLGERLRVQVASLQGRRISVQTYVRLQAVLTPALRERLRRLAERQLALAGARPAQRAASLAAFEAEVEAFRRAVADGQRPSAARGGENISLPLRDARLDLEVYVPRHLVVHAKTFKHDLRVEGCTAGTRLSTEAGTISVVDVRGDVRSYAQRGRQLLRRIKGSVSVEGGSAAVELTQIDGRVRAALLGGSIDARALRAGTATVTGADWRADLRTIRGNIDVGAMPRGRSTLLTLAGTVTLWLPRHPSLELLGRAGRWELGPFARTARQAASARPRATTRTAGPPTRGQGKRLRWGRGRWQARISTPEGAVVLRLAAKPAAPAHRP